MPQPHKGDRSQVHLNLPDEIMKAVVRDAKREGASSRSQYLADLLCQYHGRPDLARELKKRARQLELMQLPQSKVVRARAKTGSRIARRVMVRVPDEIAKLANRTTKDKKLSSRSQYLTDVVCIIYNRPDLVRELNRPEGGEQLKLSERRHEPAA